MKTNGTIKERFANKRLMKFGVQKIKFISLLTLVFSLISSPLFANECPCGHSCHVSTNVTDSYIEPVKNYNSKVGDYEIDTYDFYLLAKIIHCEDGTQKEENLDRKVAVGIVVLNRIISNRFPNTMYDVIFQKIQFSPTFDGSWEVKEPMDLDYIAAEKAIEAINGDYELKGINGDSIKNATFFFNPKYSEPDNVESMRSMYKYLDTLGSHEFYSL